jgi:transcriptional regulator with GAF, ATPase, and Fis domain
VDCCTLQETLFESELFGHERGAFTGADRRKPGLIEAAAHGTLFLDELGEAGPAIQAKLLRVIETGRFRHVGSSSDQRADVRIVTATNRDLLARSSQGLFRQDLYYRLSTFVIDVPPLRTRPEDIPLLAQHFLARRCQSQGTAPKTIAREALARLQDYPWPGNVRELRNVIERAVILARGGPLQFDLPVADPTPMLGASKARSRHTNAPGFFTEVEMENLERENLLAVLGKASWKIKGRNGAAELLGIKPTTLLSRMKKMGVERPNPHIS